MRLAELSRLLGEVGAEREQLTAGAVQLLGCVKALSLDVQEVGAAELAEQLDDLGRLLRTGERGLDLDQAFDLRRAAVLDYAERLKAYLGEREAELKRIAEMLSRELLTLGDDNDAYHRRILDRSVRLEAVSQLDDLRRMRRELQGEVAELRETVKKKQREDSSRMESLRREVSALRSDVERASAEAVTDALTGAENRLGFERHLASLLGGGRGAGQPFSLLMLDIDHFKSINDRYGHVVGDRALMALVQVCREHVRAGDSVARYGGEEFAVLLPGASARVARKRAEKLCRSQAERRYTVEGAESLAFTVSIGVACRRDDDTRDSLVERADRALYQAKHDGRNRVICVD